LQARRHYLTLFLEEDAIAKWCSEEDEKPDPYGEGKMHKTS